MHDLGDKKVEVGIALPVGMTDHVDRQAIDKDGYVGAVIGIETTEEILGCFSSSLVLDDDQAGYVIKDFLRGGVRPQLIIAGANGF